MTAVGDDRTLLNQSVATDARVVGTTTLAIALEEDGGCDADSRATINGIIKTTSSLTSAPTASITAAISGAKANNLAGD